MPPLKRSNSRSFVDPEFTLKRQFHKQSFRPHQRDIILAALDGKDVFVQAATSFGKSLCFQLPAVIDHGITIVISPLLSLVMNQITALTDLKIDARALNSTTSPSDRDAIHADLATGHPRMRLLYITPELCSTDGFRRRLKFVHEQRELARIAVDEAHCISEWGHDFRRDFKKLGWLRAEFPDVPITALTATANESVRKDVMGTLGMSEEGEGECRVFTMSAFRWNLHLEVRFTSDDRDDRFDDFVNWYEVVKKRMNEPNRREQIEAEGKRVDGVCGIIYTLSRDECETIAAALRHQGIGARPFHAKLTPEVKEATLKKWVDNEVGYDVIVATTAFGMGIDKQDVRFVVHWRLPKSFEGYYQEAGRAGRDGHASLCRLYFSREDGERVGNLVAKDHGAPSGKDSRDVGKREHSEARLKSFRRLVAYCEDTETCRHAAICKYFGEEEVPKCDYACDWHKDPKDLRRRQQAGLASEEWVSTQQQEGAYDAGWDDY